MILDLPTELLLLIAECLGPRDLFALLRTNRALVNVLTPLLLDLGARKPYTTSNTALYCAAHHGSHHLVLALLERRAALAEINIPDQSTALHWAAISGDEQTTSLLLDHGAEYLDAPDLSGNGPIFWASKAGHENIVRLLANKGAQLENRDGQLLLHNAITDAHPAIAGALLDILLKSSADVHRPDKSGWLPLHCAARHGDETTLLRLLGLKAQVNAQHPGSGVTALHRAAEGGHPNTIQLLIKHGAQVNARDHHCGATPLHWAAFRGHATAAEKLLLKGADINAVCFDGNTALHLALHDNSPAHDAVVILLLQRTNGPDVNALNNRGDTPLRWPVFSGSHSSVEIMLRAGADMFIRDSHGRTVLDCAQERLDVEMIKTLVRFGTRGVRQASSVNWKAFWSVVPRLLVKEPFEQLRRAPPGTTTWAAPPAYLPCQPRLLIP